MSLQLSSEQSVGDVRITQLHWKRVPVLLASVGLVRVLFLPKILGQVIGSLQKWVGSDWVQKTGPMSSLARHSELQQ